MSNMQGKLLFLTFPQEGLFGLLLLCVLGGDVLQGRLSLWVWGCVPCSKKKEMCHSLLREQVNVGVVSKALEVNSTLG